ncbi:S-layer homology domain-containing protein [Paenibacillus sp. GCM10023250]|uniref:S-layer homology domain-containing protein n=1 Tax=Paenibacillus sp. GCM10023250 TaxID=3252648 RepID=UPI00361F864B
MKKSLSLVVAAAMTLTTASVAFADTAPATTDLTAQQKFDALKELGIFNGYPDGSAGLDKQMTRAEFAKVLTKLAKLTENAAAAKIYTDVPATHWAAPFIGASTEAKLMNGLGANKFGPSGQVTIEQIAKVADLVAGLEPVEGDVSGKVSAWAKGYVAAAVKAGLLPELPSYQTNATRELLVEVTYDLAKPVEKELKAVKAVQSGSKKITVTFNHAASAEDKAPLTYELKSGPTSYPVTATYSEDNTTAVLSAAYLPTGDFTLTVKGSDPINLKIEAEAAKKIDITATTVQPAANQDLGVKVYNQFGEAMSVSPTISSYNVTKGKQLGNGNTLNLQAGAADEAALNDNILVTAVYPAAGLSINKTLKVTNGSAATSIKIDEVKPLNGSARVSINQTGLVLPMTLVDANGATVKLPAGTATLANGQNSLSYAGLVFFISDSAIVNGFSVDTNGVITFNTLSKAGTVYITVTNPATQATANLALVVNDVAKVKTFQLGNSGSVIVKGEKVVLPYTAIDTFGNPIAPKDLSLANVKFNAFGTEITPVKNAKGELEFKFNQTGSTNIYVYVDGVQQTSSVGIEVRDEAKYTAVNGIKDVATSYEVGASNEFDQDNITLIDNYGRVSNVAAGHFAVTSSAPGIVAYENGKLVAKAAGTATITVSSDANTGITNHTFTVSAVASSSITSYAIDSIGTLYGKSDGSAKATHAAEVTLVGKTASGVTVALVSDVPDFVTVLDESVLKTTGTSVYGLKAGKTTVSAYFNGAKVADQEVTVSEDAPVVKTVEFDKDEYTTKVGATPTVKVTVKDQYGKVIANPVGSILVNDKTIVDNNLKGLKVGSTTITYVASNNTQDTAVVVVEAAN